MLILVDEDKSILFMLIDAGILKVVKDVHWLKALFPIDSIEGGISKCFNWLQSTNAFWPMTCKAEFCSNSISFKAEHRPKANFELTIKKKGKLFVLTKKIFQKNYLQW